MRTSTAAERHDAAWRAFGLGNELHDLYEAAGKPDLVRGGFRVPQAAAKLTRGARVTDYGDVAAFVRFCKGGTLDAADEQYWKRRWDVWTEHLRDEEARRVAVVFVHGFLSSPKTWSPFVTWLEADTSLGHVEPLAFEYTSKLWEFNPACRIPDISMVAKCLAEFLETSAHGFARIVLVGHSQGGLVIQRYLADMLAAGRGSELARIHHVVLFACPNNGSEFAESVRRLLLRRNPQDERLRSCVKEIMSVQEIVLRDIVEATQITAQKCRIPWSVYAGETDKIVPLKSAQGVFPDAAGLPGGHSGIIKRHGSYATLRRLLGATDDWVRAPEDGGRRRSRRLRNAIIAASVLTVVGAGLWSMLDDRRSPAADRPAATASASSTPSSTVARTLPPTRTPPVRQAPIPPYPAGTVRWTAEGDNGTVDGKPSTGLRVYNSSRSGRNAEIPVDSLPLDSSVSIERGIEDGRPVAVGPSYSNPTPPPATRWYLLTSGKWAPAAFVDVHGAAIPECA